MSAETVTEQSAAPAPLLRRDSKPGAADPVWSVWVLDGSGWRQLGVVERYPWTPSRPMWLAHDVEGRPTGGDGRGLISTRRRAVAALVAADRRAAERKAGPTPVELDELPEWEPEAVRVGPDDEGREW